MLFPTRCRVSCWKLVTKFFTLFSGNITLLPRQTIVTWLVPERAVLRLWDVE
jgi:hypothetical protein